jgi:hypothetical protein
MVVVSPTFAGFVAFVRGTMGISSVVLPDAEPCLREAYDLSIETVNRAIQPAAPNMYRSAVYNLGGDIVINTAPDQEGSTYFLDLRAKWNVLDPTSGVVQSSSDASTSQTLTVPEQANTFTLGDLQNLKTPYGRAYLIIAQKYGTLWGIS